MNWLVEKMKEDGSKNAIIFKGKEYTYEALVEQIESYYIITVSYTHLTLPTSDLV